MNQEIKEQVLLINEKYKLAVDTFYATTGDKKIKTTLLESAQIAAELSIIKSELSKLVGPELDTSILYIVDNANTSWLQPVSKDLLIPYMDVLLRIRTN
jgi:hypothetical protein